MDTDNLIFEPDETIAELNAPQTSLPEPEHALMVAVLEDAVRCLLNRCNATDRAERELYRDAHDWFRSSEQKRLFDFENVCDVLGIEADYLRDRLFRERDRRRSLAREAQAKTSPAQSDCHAVRTRRTG